MKWNFIESQIESLYQMNQFVDESVPDLTDEQIYAQILYFYLVSDLDQLLRWSEVLVARSSSKILIEITKLRIAIRDKTAMHKEISFEYVQSDDFLKSDMCLQAEYFFVRGLCFEKKTNFIEMSKSFYKASQLYSNSGFRLKSLKSLHNYASALSHMELSPSHIHVYQDLYRQALNSQNLEIERMSLYNISVHFYKMKVVGQAFKYIEMALARFDELTLNRDHYLCLLQFCKVQMFLNKYETYKNQLDLCLQSPIIEIKKAADDILVQHLNHQATTTEAPTSWQNLKILTTDLTPAEIQLVEILMANELTKDQLIDKIFGLQIDYQSSINRLNNLLTRVRKKSGFKIEIVNNRYILKIPRQSWSAS